MCVFCNSVCVLFLQAIFQFSVTASFPTIACSSSTITAHRFAQQFLLYCMPSYTATFTVEICLYTLFRRMLFDCVHLFSDLHSCCRLEAICVLIFQWVCPYKLSTQQQGPPPPPLPKYLGYSSAMSQNVYAWGPAVDPFPNPFYYKAQFHSWT